MGGKVMQNYAVYENNVSFELHDEANDAFEEFCANHECCNCPACWPGPCGMSWLMLSSNQKDDSDGR